MALKKIRYRIDRIELDRQNWISYESIKSSNTCFFSLLCKDQIMLIKSVLNKDKKHDYHKIVLEKYSYQLAKKLSQRKIAKQNMLPKACKYLINIYLTNKYLEC